MQTLHEFMLVTKGQEYLIAIAFLVVFILFWQFLFRGRVVPEVVQAFSLESIRVPTDVWFHPGHAWMLLQPEGSVRVGIDDFIRRLTGPIDDILMPEAGIHTEQGAPLLRLKIGERELAIPSPLTGQVTSVNAKARRRIPVTDQGGLEQEWLLELHPDDPKVNTKGLRVADRAASWLEGEMKRLREFLSSQVVRPALAGVTLADGGEPITGALALLDHQGWTDFQREFLTPNDNT